jgi:PAS domain S-box-containing protein
MIHPRFRLHGAARGAAERSWQLADAVPHLVWTASADGTPDYFNARIARYRADPDDPAWQWHHLLHPEDRASTAAAWQLAVERGTAYSCEHRLAMADGGYRWHLSRAEPARDPHGRIVQWVGTATDIQDLRESEARFSALADNMWQLAWMADEGGNVYWYNRRWIEYTGRQPEEMLGHGWKSVYHPEHIDALIERVGRSISTNEPLEGTYPLLGKDGTYRWFLMRALPIRNTTGELSWFGTATDVTEQREAQEALRTADRRKDQFLAMLAHELRNPLTPIRNALHILAAPAASVDTRERARRIIERQFAHLVRMVDDLLDVSRIVRGRIELRREPCDLRALLLETVDDHRENLESAGLHVAIDAPEALQVHGDRVRLAQAIGNVLHNAARFTPAGGHVWITLRARDGLAEVCVADDGEGIDAALLGELFTPFSQADQGLARQRGGLGLGLSLVRGLLELHGGNVEVHSEGSGRGTQVILRLPLERPADAPQT